MEVYSIRMIRGLQFNSSHRVWLALLAVLLPVIALSVAQYRSLAELENKTRVAGQEQLRQALQSLMHRTREKLETLTAATLGSIDVAEIEQEYPEPLERRLAGIREAHPEIDAVFVVVNCSNRNRKFALFATADGLRRVDRDQFKKHPQTETAVALYSNAGLLRAAAGLKKEGVVFEQSCSLFSGNPDEHAQLFVFSPLHSADGHQHYGFAGMTMKSDYLKAELLPQVTSEPLSGFGKDGSPMVSIVDEHEREIFASRGGLKQHEVSMSFTPIFRRWKLGIGFPDTTIAQLARRQYWQNLLFTALALALLGGGLFLALRATAREMRLAAAKSAFVSNVSHELKTPLALIRLFAETLELGRVKSPEKAGEYHRIIHRESRRLTQLINNILDFSRIEAGRREYKLADSDAAAVVEEVLQSYEPQMTNAGFEVTKEIQPNLPHVLLDRDAIAQAVLNLLNNALKYSTERKRIEVRVYRRDDKIAIEVADSGIGIPRSEQGRIFEQFYRVSTGLVHDTKGSGLGLAIVKHIVEAHDGRIAVESAPGRGSRFTILLPPSEIAVAANATAQPHPDALGAHAARVRSQGFSE